MVIGLTGGVASGKSTVAHLFQNLGAEIIDADQVAREVVAPGSEAYQKIVAHFGEWLVDQDRSLKRRALREVVFDDPKQRLWLEQLLHPLIREQLNLRAEQSPAPYCILVIPLLTDRSHYPKMARILVVDTPEHVQLQRVQARDQITKQEAQAILNAQTTRETRLEMADDVIVNDGDINHLLQQVKALHQVYLNEYK